MKKKNPEFRYLMNEFHDGILLFEISGKKVWNRVSEDSAGLRKYYEENKTRYLTKPAIAGKLYTLHISEGEKILQSAYKKYSSKKDPDALLLKKFNRKKDSTLVITNGRWVSGTDKEIDGLKWIPGAQQFERNGFPSIINITETIEPVPLPFVEVQGEIMNSWQEFLENEWIEQLKSKYTVKVDNVVLGEIKKKPVQK